MSWSDQLTSHTTNTSETNEQELALLRRAYADAELAYQSVKREYETVAKELALLSRKAEAVKQESQKTASQFIQVQRELTEKMTAISQLILKNEHYFIQLDENSKTMDKHVHSLVAEEIARQKEQIIRLDRFTEYFPVFVSLIALAAILYFIFWT